MIKFRDKTLEEYSIDPETAVITNSKGDVQETKIIRRRPCFKGMAVHVIQVHTKYGYKKGYDIHHLDNNPMNNSLSNLVYLTHSEHTTIHKTGKRGIKLSSETRKKISEAHKGKSLSEETRKKMSESIKGAKNPIYGKRFKWINNGLEQRYIHFDEEIPEGFVRGRIK